jgi:alpha-L-rhamnosidase
MKTIQSFLYCIVLICYSINPIFGSQSFKVEKADSQNPISEIRPGRLTCEYIINPKVVDVIKPRLSYINIAKDSLNGQEQTAYQIRVASSKEKLEMGEIDLWDSKKVYSTQSTLIKYKGDRLLSRQQCWWHVRVWDKYNNPSEWSYPANWEMGLLHEGDWKCEWIGAPWQNDDPVTEKNENFPAPLFRKEFEITKDVESARAYVTGLGYFELYINGDKVSDDVLVPYRTNYHKRKSPDGNPTEDDFQKHRIMYLSYNIEENLIKGKNVIGAIVGNGFYNVTSHMWTMPYGSPRFFGQLHITFTDGTEQFIVSDATWKSSKSAILMNFIYDGEHYDARLEQLGWSEVGFDDKNWENVKIRNTPQTSLIAQTSPSDKVMERINPMKIEKLGDGHFKVDFGKQITGWLRLNNVSGEYGRKIIIKYLPEMVNNGDNSYIMRGGLPESYSARFTWFGFREVELLNWPGEIQEGHLYAESVYTEVENIGNFDCSNKLFNQINEIFKQSDNNNRKGGINMDTPQRERSGYTGDGQLRTVTQIHNFDVSAVLNKWIKDIVDSQNSKTGYVPNAVPWQPKFGGGPAWGAAINVIPWEYYIHYGDTSILISTYDAMKRYIDYLLQWVDEDGVLLSKTTASLSNSYYHNLGEWGAPYGTPPRALVHTYILWLCSHITAKTAKVLKHLEDIEKYETLANNTRHAFHNRFYDIKKGTYGPSGGNIFALRMNLPFEKSEKDRVVNFLKHDIQTDAAKFIGLTEQPYVEYKGGYAACRDLAMKYGIPTDKKKKEKILNKLKKDFIKNGGHIDVGIVGAQLFFEILAENGLNDLAFLAMNKRDIPSFGWMIDQGATTVWERWDGEASNDTPTYGGAISWFYRKLAGLNADETQPGYRNIIFRPQPVGDISYVKYSTRTPYGSASINWRKENSSFYMTVTVPVGCMATVYLPLLSQSNVINKISESNIVNYVVLKEISNEFAIYNIKSGTYSFKVYYQDK